MMTSSQALGAIVLGLWLSTSAVKAQTAAQYRDFQLGADLASVSALTGAAASEAKTLHTRPAILSCLVAFRLGDAAATPNGDHPVGDGSRRSSCGRPPRDSGPAGRRVLETSVPQGQDCTVISNSDGEHPLIGSRRQSFHLFRTDR